MAGNIAADAITSAKIATGAVIADSIAAGAIIADKIGANEITAGKLEASLTLATTAHTTLPVYWYVPDNITIDAIEWFSGAESATGDVLKAVMMAYDLDKANGSTSGDLTNGSVVASSSNVTNNGYEQIHYNSMSVSSPNVDAGKCILLCVACDTVNSDYAISATVKYHLR